MSRRIFAAIVIVAGILFLCGYAGAQKFLSMTDRKWIELSIDQIRKGIQQEDTAKIMAPLAGQVVTENKIVQTRETVCSRFQTLFDRIPARQSSLAAPSYPRADSPYRGSAFWDFDILDPQITIRGDSAFVDCELVLWGTKPAKVDGRHGLRTREQFIFVAQANSKDVPAGEEYGTFDPPEKPRPKVWRLATLGNLLEFLESQQDGDKGASKTYGRKRL
ncbi:MAG: hypothetical protein GYA46_10295 [candidate division Zixibacteria bacterium]|nr:hypothetical protein [candidate division Zixibacteria bacterium]